MDDFHYTGQAFLAWLQRSGAELSPKIKLEDLRHHNAGRGIVATQDIAENELLFRIPRSAVLSVDNSILSTEIPAATVQALGPWLSLILVMLYEEINGGASNWSPYFDILPSNFDTLMFWSADELAELQASTVLYKVGKEGSDNLFMEQLVPVIIEFADIFFSGDPVAKQAAEQMRSPSNLELMHKMGSLIMAYAFDIEPATSNKNVDEEGYMSEDEDAALPKGMIPLADMLNADADRCNARLFYDSRDLEMKALKPIKASEEIFNDYGPLPRSDLLRRYGYITDNYAQYDVVEMPMSFVVHIMNANMAYDLARLEYLDQHDIIDGGYDITVSNPFTLQESLSPELIILIETLLLPDDEFSHLKVKSKLPKPERMTSKCADTLLKIVQARLAQYATPLEEDVGALQRMPAPGEMDTKQRRYAMALAVRVGEKQILSQTREALAERIARDGVTSKRQRGVDEEGDTDMGGTDKRQRARNSLVLR